MRAQHDPCACELHSDELQCWKSGAQGAVDVARRATNTAEPDGKCWPSALTSDIGTPPATPSSRRVAAAAGGEALDTPFKRSLFATLHDKRGASPDQDAVMLTADAVNNAANVQAAAKIATADIVIAEAGALPVCSPLQPSDLLRLPRQDVSVPPLAGDTRGKSCLTAEATPSTEKATIKKAAAVKAIALETAAEKVAAGDGALPAPPIR